MSGFTRRIGLVLAVIGVAAFAASRAEAQTTYEISGNFGTNLFLNPGLSGGSFSGTYTTSDLPVAAGHSGTFTSYNIDIYNSSHGLVLDLTNSESNSSSIFRPDFPIGPNNTELTFNELNSHHLAVFSMSLFFTSPFDGSGSLVPWQFLNLESSTYSTLNLNHKTGIGAIVSGTSAVPEPSSLILGILGSVGALACWRRSRRKRACATPC